MGSIGGGSLTLVGQGGGLVLVDLAHAPGLKDMPANPDLVIFKIEPERAYFIDNTVAFGHRDMVQFK